MAERLIINFFKKEAPAINITGELLANPSSKVFFGYKIKQIYLNLQIDEIIQAYFFLCELVLEDMSVDPGDEKCSETMSRPLFIVKTREAVWVFRPNLNK